MAIASFGTQEHQSHMLEARATLLVPASPGYFFCLDVWIFIHLGRRAMEEVFHLD
jgi:hypothetical protein